jgi:hypothetical protein
LEHRRSRVGSGIGGVIGMDMDTADVGRRAAEACALTWLAAQLAYRDVLFGGMPGSGKSGVLNSSAAHAALSAEQDITGDPTGVPRSAREA